MTLRSFYQSRCEHFAGEENRAKARARLYTTGRLITALFALAAFWQAITDASGFAGGGFLWVLAGTAGVLLFLLMVVRHLAHRRRQRYAARLKAINEKEIASLEGGPDLFPDGNGYMETGHAYAYDLDIFGNNSLFQLINRTACLSGEASLAERLTSPPGNEVMIRERQQAVAELAEEVDFRQHFQAKGQIFNENPLETQQLRDWLNAPADGFDSPLFRVLRYLLPAMTLALLALAVSGVLPHTWWVLAVLFNLTFTGFFLKRINRFHAAVSRKHRLLEKFSLLLEHISKQEFGDPMLQSLRKESLEAFAAIRRLTRILGFFDQRLNLMVAGLLNGFLLADFHSVTAVGRWRVRYRDRMPSWLDRIFAFDELNSFANFAFNHPGYCYPEFREASLHETPLIAAEQLGHPLIGGHECVLNDFSTSADEKVVILTGANMSGKSTFLRSLGINLVLAYAGAPVFARKFSCCLAGIWSSMRVTDSLSDDTSYFYAELKRLSAIMEQLRAGRKLLVLLDEILKGTNSADKLHGSVGLVEEFLAHDCLCVVATHDLELGKLEETHPAQVRNYCFESSLENNELHFDYLLKKGVAKNKNATFLMRKTGLIR